MVTYHTNREDIQLDSVFTKYGEQVFQPTLYTKDYVFKGWYLDSTLTKTLQGTMPPYAIDLYAKWVEKE